MIYPKSLPRLFCLLVCLSLLLGACAPLVDVPPATEAVVTPTTEPTPGPTLTPYPERPAYPPGELVDYVAQPGDTLPVLAVHFNTRVAEILEANPFIPHTATTMPPGMPMKIPIYYTPFWGSSYQMIPDSLYINGPAQLGFDTAAYIASQPGWLNGYREYAADSERDAADVVDLVALNYSVSPRLLLALLEYQSQAISQPEVTPENLIYPLGYHAPDRQGLYRQLIWTANTLNNGYYGWRTGRYSRLETSDGRIENFDPWQNAATVALHHFFNKLLAKDDYLIATAPEGFAQTYRALFGDPWPTSVAHIPGSLEQPPFQLPFRTKEPWAFTGGPHTAWGLGDPLAALDFAPPNISSGCSPSSEQATAVASGLVVRSEIGVVVLDLDSDGDERTGWVVFYLHVGSEKRAAAGTALAAGDPLGYPSCEGGSSTGTHVHIARKYNGEWIPAEGTLAFNLDGWVAHNGSQPYLGTLTRLSRTVTACVCSNQASFVSIEER